MEPAVWIHDPAQTQQLLQGLLADMAQALSTPPADWRDEPLCRQLLTPYEKFCACLAQLVCDAYSQSVRCAIQLWADEPGQLPNNGDLEDWALELLQEQLRKDLPEKLELWFTSLNDQLSDILQAHFSQAMIARYHRPVVFPGLYMGQWQVDYTQEIAYDMVIMIHKRLVSCGFSRILPVRRFPRWLQRPVRRHTLRQQEGDLEMTLYEDELEFRYDYEVYLLSKEFLEGYRDCILENLREWVAKPLAGEKHAQQTSNPDC